MVPLSSYRGVFFQRRVLEGTDAKYYFTENLEGPRLGFGLHVEKNQLLKARATCTLEPWGLRGRRGCLRLKAKATDLLERDQSKREKDKFCILPD